MEIALGYVLCWEPRCLWRRYSGRLTGQEIVSSLREICADPRFDDIRAIISDFGAVEGLVVSEDEAALIAALQIGAGFTNPHIRIVQVATNATLVAELTRLVHLFEPSIRLSFHATVADARAWLRAEGVAIASGC